MTTINCRRCGKSFEPPHKNSGLCSSDCFTAGEREQSLLARKTYSPVRKRAIDLVQRAKERGELKRQPCEVCGEVSVVAHHDDYAKPLDVRWLCRSHHQKWHIEHGKGANA